MGGGGWGGVGDGVRGKRIRTPHRRSTLRATCVFDLGKNSELGTISHTRTCTHTKIRHTRSGLSDLAEVTAKIHENMRTHTSKHKHGHIQERRLGEKKMKHDLVWSHLKLENVGHSSPAR